MVAMKLDSAAACSRFLSLYLSLFSFASISSTRRVVDRTRARLFDPFSILVVEEEEEGGSTKRACVARAKALAFSREEKQGRSRFVPSSFDARIERMRWNDCRYSSPPPEPTNERTSRFMPVHSPNEPFAPSNPPGTIILPESRKLPVKTIHLSPIPVKLYPCSRRDLPLSRSQDRTEASIPPSSSLPIMGPRGKKNDR